MTVISIYLTDKIYQQLVAKAIEAGKTTTQITKEIIIQSIEAKNSV